MRTRLGIDEAGRGCVLGPMVFGAVLVAEQDEGALFELGARDSKKLRPARREALVAPIRGLARAWQIVELSPAALDAESLGELGKRTIVELALALRPDVLVLDAPVPPRGIPAFAAEIRSRLRDGGLVGVEIVAENGADDRHPCCSAASILAKTRRDAVLEGIEAEAGTPLGSGYPSDPTTRAWLEATWRRTGTFPPFVRRKWETVRRLMAEGAQQRLF